MYYSGCLDMGRLKMPIFPSSPVTQGKMFLKASLIITFYLKTIALPRHVNNKDFKVNISPAVKIKSDSYLMCLSGPVETPGRKSRMLKLSVYYVSGIFYIYISINNPKEKKRNPTFECLTYAWKH